MEKYNEALVKAGVLLAAEGLHPSSRGARIQFDDGVRTVVDGPSAGTKDQISGFWLIQVKSKEEAVEWALRVPFEADDPSVMTRGVGQIELRQVFEASDFLSEPRESADGRSASHPEQGFR